MKSGLFIKDSMLWAKLKIYRPSILIPVGCIIWLIICQLVFLGIQRSLSQKVVQIIQNQFRQELDFSNFHFLSRGLIDYERSGSINCILLKKSNPEIVILDRRALAGNCFDSNFWLNGEQNDVKLKTLNGDEYSLSFISRNDFLFYGCLWSLRIVGLLLLGGGFVIYRLSKRAEYLKLENEKSLIAERQMIARQVAHDIRSPLSALTMVASTLKDLPEDKRILIRNATQRINDIANDLLQKGQLRHHSGEFTDDKAKLKNNGVEKSGQHLIAQFIPALVDILASEKRMQYREYTDLEIDVDFENSFGAFSLVNHNELKRVISNLVNNSVEALDNHHGKIIIGVRKIESINTTKVEIFVRDDGKGIPSHLINKIGQAGFSFGKSSSGQSGAGLGLFHAKRTIESFGGDLQIDSTESRGSTIRIILPLAQAPKWFANKIDLEGIKYLVTLDDDISIHQIWAGRLQSLGLNNIEHIKFQSGDTFEKYVNSNINKLRKTLFLIDYELLNQSKSGLDIIEDLSLEKYSILVTSRYEEPDIQSRAKRRNLLLLPKGLAGFVPIEISQALEKFDWVLLDDDDLVHMSWSYAARELNKTFLGFKNVHDFNSYKDKLDRSTILYIDSNLGNDFKGEEVAQILFNEGFKSIYICSGYNREYFTNMHFIKGVVGKEPPTT